MNAAHCPPVELECPQCVRPAIPDGTAAVVFDFDGTIADTTLSHEQSLREALQPYGLSLDSGWYREHIGLSVREMLADLRGAEHLPHDEIIQRSRAQLLASISTITPIRCVVSLLHAARGAGLPCAIASGTTRRLVEPGLAALSLSSEFDAVVVREDAPLGKPAPDLYAKAALWLGVPPARCLAVDDALDGVASAQAAGMAVLTVIGGHLAATNAWPRRETGRSRHAT